MDGLSTQALHLARPGGRRFAVRGAVPAPCERGGAALKGAVPPRPASLYGRNQSRQDLLVERGFLVLVTPALERCARALRQRLPFFERRTQPIELHVLRGRCLR